MKKLDRQRKITLAALSMALVVAVYLNWQYTRTGSESYIVPEDANAQYIEQVSLENIQFSDADMLSVAVEEEIKNYGDAQLVATTAKSTQKYFEETRLMRQKSRDEALDILQKSLKNAKLSDTEKAQATEKLSDIIQDITTETDVENLVKAKGFVECVAFISDGKISIAVQTSAGDLTKQKVAQVRDIVLNKTDIAPQDIVVIEVK